MSILADAFFGLFFRKQNDGCQKSGHQFTLKQGGRRIRHVEERVLERSRLTRRRRNEMCWRGGGMGRRGCRIHLLRLRRHDGRFEWEVETRAISMELEGCFVVLLRSLPLGVERAQILLVIRNMDPHNLPTIHLDLCVPLVAAVVSTLLTQ